MFPKCFFSCWWIGVGLALFGIVPLATPADQKITVTGKLIRAMAIGGESTGWAIQLDPEIVIDGKSVHSIEVSFADIKKLQELENKRVEASGTLSRRHGVERGYRPVLHIASIRAAAGKAGR